MAYADPILQKEVLRTTHCGDVNVFILGEYANLTNKVVFLTVHDFGSNAHSFDKFILHESMAEVRPRSVWLNFEVPGQGLNAPDLPANFKFPSLDEIAEDLTEVLDQLQPTRAQVRDELLRFQEKVAQKGDDPSAYTDVQYVVGLGEGAGANILTRFAIANPIRVLGLILIHPTATSAGWVEWVKEKFLSWKLKTVGLDPSAEEYLVLYKFGSEMENATVDTREKIIQEYLTDLRSKVNPKNLHAYMHVFMSRSDLTNHLRDLLTCDTIIICGTNSSFHHTVHTMNSHMNLQKSSLLDISGVGDALNEAPDQVARGLVLFCKGLGLLITVNTPAEKRASVSTPDGAPRRRRSMQEADQPQCA